MHRARILRLTGRKLRKPTPRVVRLLLNDQQFGHQQPGFVVLGIAFQHALQQFLGAGQVALLPGEAHGLQFSLVSLLADQLGGFPASLLLKRFDVGNAFTQRGPTGATRRQQQSDRRD